MKNKIIHLLAVFCIFSAITFSQTVEIVETDSVKNQITGTETGMYGGTKSQEAQNFFNKASDYFVKNDFENAKKNYLKAIDADPNYIEAYDNVAVIFRKLKDYDKAIEYYKKSIELYPDGAMAHQNLALVYSLLTNYEGAIEEYEILIKLNPNDPEGYFGIANCNMMLSNFDMALTNAEKAVKIYEDTGSPLLADGQYMIGLIYYYKGEIGRASCRERV